MFGDGCLLRCGHDSGGGHDHDHDRGLYLVPDLDHGYARGGDDVWMSWTLSRDGDGFDVMIYGWTNSAMYLFSWILASLLAFHLHHRTCETAGDDVLYVSRVLVLLIYFASDADDCDDDRSDVERTTEFGTLTGGGS